MSFTFEVESQLVSIGDTAFRRCLSLTSIDIPDSVTEIKRQAFKESGITSINIPSSVTHIVDYVFSKCPNLETVVLGDGVQKIDNYTFEECTSLNSITIPDSIEEITGLSFKGCSDFTVYITNTKVIDINYLTEGLQEQVNQDFYGGTNVTVEINTSSLITAPTRVTKQVSSTLQRSIEPKRSTAPKFWEMRNEKANYYEIRYKPLIPIKDYSTNSNGEDKSLKISFTFGENLQSKTTFERYTSMQGVPTPVGNTHYDAVREEETIELSWVGDDISIHKKIIIIDVASGYSLNSATITTTSNIYNISKQNQSNFDIKSYVYALKISDPINNLDYKFINTAIKNFTETNTSDMVKNNRRFNLTFVPNDPNTNYNIFTYDDSIRGVNFRNNPLDERKISNQDTPLNLILELEKIDLEDYNSISDSFENATNVNSSINNVNIINEQIIYLFNNKFSNSSGVEISNPIITIDMNNYSIENIALTKGLINNTIEKSKVATRTIPELKQVNSTELKFFMFLIKQNFLSDYWKFKDNLSDLSLSTGGNILNQKMLEYDYQRRVAASVHLIDIALSGQIFLINTAKNKTNVSYIKTLDSEILDGTQLIGNPTISFNNVINFFHH